MKTIGLIGGISWESSSEYYRLVNQGIKARLGGTHSAKCVMVSVDFAEIEALQRQGRWDDAARAMIDAARSVEKGGADFIVICTNTMHKVADEVQGAVGIPLLHIADAAAEKVKSAGSRAIGLLGTKFTMEEDFYRRHLEEAHGLKVMIPEAKDRDFVHRVIFGELVLGRILPDSKAGYLRIIDELSRKGAEGVVLGCTEIGLLVKQADTATPLFDTTAIHAEAAVAFALKN